MLKTYNVQSKNFQNKTNKQKVQIDGSIHKQ